MRNLLALSVPLSFGVVFFGTGSAHAIPAPPPPPENAIVFETREFTSGSAIIGRLSCAAGCTFDQLTFSEEAGMLISGQLVDVTATLGADYFAWLPDAPPVPGPYYAGLSVGTLTGDPQIEIIEASSALPTVMADLVNFSEVTGERVDCSALASTAIEQGFYEQALYQVAVSATVSGENASQYVFDLRLAGDEANKFVGRSFGRDAAGEPAEVCFEVFARPIVGGEDVSLTVDCLSTEGLTLGVVEEVSGGMASGLKLCTVPPDGYFEEWCAAFAEQFAAQSCAGTHPEACFAARQDCPEGDHPTDEEVEAELGGSGGGPAGTGGDVNGGGAAGSGANGSGADGSMSGGGSSEDETNGSSDSDSSSDQGSCSVSPVGAGSTGRLWLFMGLGLLAAVRRRTQTSVR